MSKISDGVTSPTLVSTGEVELNEIVLTNKEDDVRAFEEAMEEASTNTSHIEQDNFIKDIISGMCMNMVRDKNYMLSFTGDDE